MFKVFDTKVDRILLSLQSESILRFRSPLFGSTPHSLLSFDGGSSIQKGPSRDGKEPSRGEERQRSTAVQRTTERSLLCFFYLPSRIEERGSIRTRDSGLEVRLTSQIQSIYKGLVVDSGPNSVQDVPNPISQKRRPRRPSLFINLFESYLSPLSTTILPLFITGSVLEL